MDSVEFEGDQFESEHKMIDEAWPVYTQYEIIGSMIVASGEVAYRYFPALRTELSNVMQNVNADNDEEVLDFVRVYGLMGYDNVVTQEEWGHQASKLEAESVEFHHLEPLHFFRGHIQTIRSLMEMVKCFKETDIPKARAIVDGKLSGVQRVSRYKKIETLKVHTHRYMNRTRWQNTTNLSPSHDPLEAVAEIICEVVNCNLEGVARQLSVRHTDNGPEIRSFFRGMSLVQAAYWDIANVMNGGQLAECKYCYRPFIAKDGRQKFCPPRMNEEVSRCANLKRQERWRDARKQKAGKGE